MRRLQGRVKKLESALLADPLVGDPITRQYHYALSLLSVEDRALRDEAVALKRGDTRGSWTEAHEAVWKRWDDALTRAVDDLELPLWLSAIDMLL